MSLAPLALFVFNRPEHTRRMLESLRANLLAPKSDLYVFADGARSKAEMPKVEAVRKLIQHLDGFLSITLHYEDKNRGLAGSVIDGVSRIISQAGRVIALEDDLLFRRTSSTI